RALGVSARLLPMSDDPVRTRLRTPDGWLSFQEYFVREKALVDVLEVVYDGAAAARPAPGVLAAIAGAEAVIVCPSNPVTSVGPVLAVPGIARALAATRAPVVAVSPIVGGAAVSGPAARLMRMRGLDVSPAGVAAAYAPWLRHLLIDARDAGSAPALEGLGVGAVVGDIVMADGDGERALAVQALRAAGCRP
ncbi:MAG: 2-phospho-L-lactate transferase CofD family protein, partial [Candidatus Rokuibacteriota bacterium]